MNKELISLVLLITLSFISFLTPNVLLGAEAKAKNVGD